MKKSVIIITAIAILIIVAIFFYPSSNEKNSISQSSNLEFTQSEVNSGWLNTEIIDIRTREKLVISQINKPVLLESFAVWCPTCTRQQNEIKKLHEEIGDSVVSISLDTDPNEDESKIIQHIERNGFNWHYAISPPELTSSLIEEFGNGIVNAPSVPVILICPDNTYTLLKSGIKKSSELISLISQCEK